MVRAEDLFIRDGRYVAMEPFRVQESVSDSPDSVDDRSIKNTAMSASEDFHEFLNRLDGFEPDADAYVYAVALRRKRDDTRWYYVGQTRNGEPGLKSRFIKHIRGEMTKTVQQDGIDVLDGPLDEDTRDAYAAIGVERIEPVSIRQQNPSTEESLLLKSRVLEREREMAYEVALEKGTMRVLGGA